VHNFDVCNGCFNKYVFDRGDWNWCPKHKNTNRQFECTKNITPEMVADKIIKAQLLEKLPTPFDFNSYHNNIEIKKEDLKFEYDKEKNKIFIYYTGDTDTKPVNIEFKDFYTKKSYHIIPDAELSKNHIIWAIPKDIIYKFTNKIIVSIYEKEIIIDIDFQF